jgi:hypothetical protein
MRKRCAVGPPLLTPETASVVAPDRAAADDLRAA